MPLPSSNSRGSTSAGPSTSIPDGEPQPSATDLPSPSDDPFNLERFITAQDTKGVKDKKSIFDRVVEAIREGHRKPQPARWMWFVFPQMDHCKTACRGPDKPDVWRGNCALRSLDEARALLCHPVLGPRAREAARALLASPQVDKFTVMDNMFYDVGRLHSSLTIFHQAATHPLCIHHRADADSVGENGVFRDALLRYFPKELDSDDEDYRSEEEDCDVRQRVATRHRPTLRRLVAMEMEPLQERLESDDASCVCGQPEDVLAVLDRGIVRKVAKKRAEQHVKNLKTFENERLILAKNMEKEDEMIVAALNAYQKKPEKDVAEGSDEPWAAYSSKLTIDTEYWAMFKERFKKEAHDRSWALMRLEYQEEEEEEDNAAMAGTEPAVDHAVKEVEEDPAVEERDSDAMSTSTFG